MKKVLIWGMTSNWGGIESVLYNYVMNSDKNKIKYDFITTFETIPREDELIRFGCQIIHLPARKTYYMAYKKSLKNFMKRHATEYDAVWLNDCMFGNIDILKYAKKYGIERRIVHAHNANSLGGGRSRYIRHKLNTAVLPLYVTDFWACSQLAGEWTYNNRILSKSNYKVIRNAINCERYKFDKECRDVVRKRLGIADHTFVVGHIGRFDYQKNHPYLLKVFSNILRKNTDSCLVLVGTGTDWKEVKEQAMKMQLDKKVLFLGQRDDIPELLSAFDVFVLPSRFEGLPVVLVEAMASGLHCFISDKVTEEARLVPELSHFKSIECNSAEWAEDILSTAYQSLREDKYRQLQKKGFDIATQANVLSDIF